MPTERLPVAVIGLGSSGRMTLRALQGSDLVRIAGVADRDMSLAERIGEELHVPAFADNRALLARQQPEAVYLTVPHGEAPEIVAACAERGIHVWKELPLARSLAEGAAMAKRMGKAGLKLAIGTQRRFAPGYRDAYQRRGELAGTFLARAHYTFNWGPDLTWHGDKAGAGGGALLELGYHLVDLLVWFLDLPEEVFGASAGGHRTRQERPLDQALPIYDTDDTAVGVFNYGPSCMASLVTSRCAGPVSEGLILHGRAGSLTADGESCTFRDADGIVLEATAGHEAPLDVHRRQLAAFAQAVIDKSLTYRCSGFENLLNQAVIDALYLAAQTGQPESPLQLLQPHDLTVEDCLRYRRVD